MLTPFSNFIKDCIIVLLFLILQIIRNKAHKCHVIEYKSKSIPKLTAKIQNSDIQRTLFILRGYKTCL